MARRCTSRHPGMEFKPALPQRNDNVSHERPMQEFVLLLAGIGAFCTLLFLASGWLIDVAVSRISPEMEARIFTASSSLVPDGAGEADPRRAALQRMVDALRPCLEIGYPLRVALVASSQANAMAAPGGRVIVLEGLLAKVRSENGLAFVLAHELAHFKNRDHLAGLGRGMVLTALTAMLTGADSGLTRLIAPAAEFGIARYSQERELRADDLALQALACRYGHVGGADEFFAAMAQESSIASIGSYFASHPEARERIKKMEEAAIRRGVKAGAVRELPDPIKPDSIKQ